MSTKAQLIARIAELETANAALEARVAVGLTLYKALRDSVKRVETPATNNVAAMPVVERYRDRLGREWIRTRTGNKAVCRLVA